MLSYRLKVSSPYSPENVLIPTKSENLKEPPPMWNNEKALQGFTTLQLSVPLGHSVCLSFSPIEDDYLRNAPTGKRRNYFSSSVGLKIERGSNPNEKCY